MPVKLEICVDSLESAMNAQRGGADRLELCSCLCLGGLTPTIGLLKAIKKHSNIPVFCMIRSRHEHFVYTDMEMDVMREDLRALKQAAADGFVFGALTENGDVDEEKCKDIIRDSSPLPVTFHRAFDCSPMEKWKGNLWRIITLGFARLLTSGLSGTASQGVEMIGSMIKEADGRLTILIGSGVDEGNLVDLMKATGASFIEYHGSASRLSIQHPILPQHPIFHSPFPLKVTCMEKVKRMRRILDEYKEAEHANTP